MDNAVLLCTHHHPFVHELGWMLELVDGAWVAHPPAGPPLTAAGATGAPGQPPAGSSPSR